MNPSVDGSDDDELWPDFIDCGQCGAAIAVDGDPVWTHYEWCMAVNP